MPRCAVPVPLPIRRERLRICISIGQEVARLSADKACAFLKKPEKNVWLFWLRRGRARSAQSVKVFGSFFQKRTAFVRLSFLRPVSPSYLGSNLFFKKTVLPS
jgi:hypothetical protein